MMNVDSVSTVHHTITITVDYEGMRNLNAALNIARWCVRNAIAEQSDEDERKRLDDAITTLSVLYSSIPFDPTRNLP